MSADRQRQANRRNARASTGPTTDGGKRRSSQNSRRHGLASAPSPDDVVRWYRIILNAPRAVLNPASLNEVERAALALADAEARLFRVRQAETDNLWTDDRDDVAEGGGANEGTLTVAGFAQMRRFEADQSDDGRLVTSLLNMSGHSCQGDTCRFCRYRAEAEGRRRRALQRWIEILQQVHLPKRTQFRL